MHLTSKNCFSYYHPTDDETTSNYTSIVTTMIQCTITWLLQSKTIFYQYNNFTLPIYFGINCWNYMIAGFVMIYTYQPYWLVSSSKKQLAQQDQQLKMSQNMNYESAMTKIPKFPYYTFALFLIFIQSPLSFLADYVYMDKNSIFHVIDRIVAVPLMTLECYKVVCMWYYNYLLFDDYRKATYTSTNGNSNVIQMVTCTNIIYMIGTILAIVSFLYSQQAQSQIDLNGFILWHNRWHMYPLYASIVTLYDYYIVLPMVRQLHEQQQQQQQKRQVPLSTSIIMKLSSVIQKSQSISKQL